MYAGHYFNGFSLMCATQGTSSELHQYRSKWNDLISIAKPSTFNPEPGTGGPGSSGFMDIRNVIETSLRELLPGYLRQALAPEDSRGSDQRQDAGPRPGWLSGFPLPSQDPGRVPESPLERMSTGTRSQQFSGDFSFKVPLKSQGPDSPSKKHRGGPEERNDSPLSLFSSKAHGFPQKPTHSLIKQQLPVHGDRFPHGRNTHRAAVSQRMSSSSSAPLRPDNRGFGEEHPSLPDVEFVGERWRGDDPFASRVSTPKSSKPLRQADPAKPSSGTVKRRRTHGKTTTVQFGGTHLNPVTEMASDNSISAANLMACLEKMERSAQELEGE